MTRSAFVAFALFQRPRKQFQLYCFEMLWFALVLFPSPDSAVRRDSPRSCMTIWAAAARARRPTAITAAKRTCVSSIVCCAISASCQTRAPLIRHHHCLQPVVAAAAVAAAASVAAATSVAATAAQPPQAPVSRTSWPHQAPRTSAAPRSARFRCTSSGIPWVAPWPRSLPTHTARASPASCWSRPPV